jgi:predicted ribosome quality control (RQC) complex YloA/Tae2 family protein
MEAQKIDSKQLQQEKHVLKKLQNVKQDHESRVKALEEAQVSNARKAEIITLNLDKVEKALTVLRSAVANQMSWSEIQDIVGQAASQGDAVASRISKLKFEHNKFEMRLPQTLSDEVQVQLMLMVTLTLTAFWFYMGAKLCLTQSIKPSMPMLMITTT